MNQNYNHLLSFFQTRSFFNTDNIIDEIKEKQIQYFKKLSKITFDEEFIDSRISLGIKHEKIHLPFTYFLGSFKQFQCFLNSICLKEYNGSIEKQKKGLKAISKLSSLDTGLVLSSYESIFAENLEKKKSALTQLNLEGDNFFRIILHELGTPLNIASNYYDTIVENLKDKKDDSAKWVKWLGRIEDSISRLTILREDLGPLSHLYKFPDLILSSLNDCIDETISECLQTFSKKTIKLNWESKEDIQVKMNYESFKNALIKIFMAITFHSPEKGTIDINIQENKKDISIQIDFNSSRIPKEEFQQIFELNAGRSLSKEDYRIAISLFISKMIIDGHKGNINIKSLLENNIQMNISLNK